MWHLQPSLVGQIVRLEPLATKHRDGLLAAARPTEIWDYWSFNPGTSEAAFDNWFEHCLQTAEEGGDAHFATILRATGAPVGSTSFCTVRERDRGLEIGWTWLTPAVWGTGANTEAKFLQLRHAFETLGCIRVDFDTYEQNARSRAALARLPAQFEGVWRNYSIRESDGTVQSSAFYSVIDDEWPTVRANLIARLDELADACGT
ncbi:MAG TPA: GNAT family protein [Solirubrobacteraceae bacterium]|jgi:RimJ/RimL family protein N-acetyltransferase|nr:GNAT family protein [Solirubrobacteraceae bacterium]